MQRSSWRFIATLLSLYLGVASAVEAQQRTVGTIAGSFDVSAGGSARFTLPLRVATGTAGTAPSLALTYDSQGTGGVLGAGWSLTGISAITRGPRSLHSDGLVQGVRLTDSDALYLDGQKLVPVADSGAGATRRREYRKEADDISRIIQIGVAPATQFVVQTKGAATLRFDGSNNSAIRVADGSIIRWAVSRIVDSAGNYIEFRYNQNGQGEHTVSSIRYTGHETRDSSGNVVAEQKPYASVDFTYDTARPIEGYVAGRLVQRSARLKSVASRITDAPDGGASAGWPLFGKYEFEYAERPSANRFVLERIRHFGEGGTTEMEPTNLKYSASVTAWRTAAFQFPLAVLAREDRFANGYRFARFSELQGSLPDLLFAAQIDGKLEAFAFRNEGGTWTRADEFKPPIPFVSGDGADLGVVVIDLNGDGRADILQSHRRDGEPPARSAHLASQMRWDKAAAYEVPFDISQNGRQTAVLRFGKFSGSGRFDLAYEAAGSRGLLLNTGAGWQAQASHVLPTPLTEASLVLDADCDGRSDLLMRTNGGWRAYTYEVSGWRVMSSAFVPPIPQSVDAAALRSLHLDGDSCPDLIASDAKAVLRKAYLATATGWKEQPERAPPFDIVDKDGVPVGVEITDIDRDGRSDAIAARRDPDGSLKKFAHRQTASGWVQMPGSFEIPVLADRTDPALPIAAFVGDIDGDGLPDVARPTGRRDGFGRVFKGSPSGFSENPAFAPDVAFARKDQQDRGVRFVDLNSDGLPDVIFSRASTKGGATTLEAGAFINTGKGWVAEPGLVPPVAFASDSIAGNPVQLVDVDGDGFIDLLHSYQKADGKLLRAFYRNERTASGSRKWVEQSSSLLIPPPSYPFAIDNAGDQGVRLVDLNGDGRVDMLVGRLKPRSGDNAPPIERCTTADTGQRTCELNRELFEVAAFLNDGSQWVPSKEYSPPVPFIARGARLQAATSELFVQIVDLDGDGLPDIAARFKHPHDTSREVSEAWLNSGVGWMQSADTRSPVLLDSPLRNPRALVQWLDVNGDGLADVVYTERRGASNASTTWLSTGRGFIPKPEWRVPLEAIADRGGDPSFRLVDVDGDGYLDILYSRRKSDATVERGMYFNNGSTWVIGDAASVSSVPAISDEHGLDLGVRLVDVDGNGLLDVVQSYARGDSGVVAERVVQVNLGRRSDILTDIDSGYGLRTTIGYQTLLESESPETPTGGLPWKRVYEPPQEAVAYPIISPVPTAYVVRSVTTAGAGSKTSQLYRYGGFRMHASARQSLGYAWRESFSEDTQVLSRIEYAQGLENVGRPTREATCLLRSAVIPQAGSLTNLCPANPSTGSISLLSETLNDWRVASQQVAVGVPRSHIWQVYLAASVSTSRELDGRLVSREATTLSYDSPASVLDRRQNLLTSKVSRLDGTSIETVNEYAQDDSQRWYFGRITSSAVTRSGDLTSGGAGERKSERRVVRYSYYTATGLLRSSTMEPDSPLALTTAYGRDKFGNVTTKTLSALGEQPRTNTTVFDDLGRLVVEERNALQQPVAYTRKQTTGAALTVTDPNFLVTTYTYDGFGRSESVKGPTGLTTRIDRSAATARVEFAGVPAAYGERTTTGSMRPTIRVFDAYGRLLRTVSDGFTLDGKTERLVFTDFVYDNLGRLKRASLPYERGASPLWQETTYDVLGRAVAQVRPDGKIVRTEYMGSATGEGGRASIAVDELGRRTTTEFSSRGLVVAVIDSDGGRARYTYDAGDRLETISGPTGATTRYGYDRLGLRRSLLDPDKGLVTFDYDAFGQIRSRKDAKGQTTTFEHDLLGRLKRRSAGGSASIEWEYDTADKGIGRIKSVRDPNRFEKQFFYDPFGRLQRTDVTIAAETFSTVQEFDEYGRVRKTRYPSPSGSVVISNVFDAKGFFTRVTSENGHDVYWEVLDVDALGRVRRERYGNGTQTESRFDATTGLLRAVVAARPDGTATMNLAMEYDGAGNLIKRRESNQAINETYGYDSLNRIALYKPSTGPEVRSRYDAAGRIVERTDVGTFDYWTVTSGVAWQPHHAVLKTRLGASSESFEYDSNGNAAKSASRTLKFTADDQLSEVVRDSAHWNRFDYDPSGDRYRQVTRDGSSIQETTYVGAFERVRELTATDSDQVQLERHRYYLTNPNGVFAVLELRVKPQAQVAQANTTALVAGQGTWYLHRDHIGSVVRIADERGEVAARYWHDPWGRQISATLLGAGQVLGSTWRRGFTGHEHLRETQLIHMNGRVYDHRSGMFLSADPAELRIWATQGLGRYRYALNNPLRYTDPTGLFDLRKAFKGGVIGLILGGPGGAAAGFLLGGHDETREWIEQNWREVAVVAVAVGVTVVTAGTAGPILAGMAAGAASGGLQAALYGGSFSDVLAGSVRGAVVGGISAGAFYAAGSAFSGAPTSLGAPDSFGAVLAHGTVGGGMSSLEGGDFWTGFAAGAFTKASSAYGPNFNGYGANLARAAIVGGTASAISGGKFANGAVIGAFSYAFNDAMHPAQPTAEIDPYAMPADVMDGDVQVHMGSSFGYGPKVFDVFGDPKLGASASYGVLNVDSIFGTGNKADLFIPSVGPNCPYNLCGASVGATARGYTYGASASVRVLPMEVSASWSVNVQRLHQWVESSIYRLYGVGPTPR